MIRLRDLHWALRSWLCAHGLHWPIRWSHAAYPASWEPPCPPEPGWACEWCGDARYPYRAWWWHLEERWARVRDRLHLDV